MGEGWGRSVFEEWLETLSDEQAEALLAAIETTLGRLGVAVCGSEFGKHLGQGLFEFRVRHKALQRFAFRVFCHAWGNRQILLLGGYDKAADPSPRRQAREIERARHRLREWKHRLTLH